MKGSTLIFHASLFFSRVFFLALELLLKEIRAESFFCPAVYPCVYKKRAVSHILFLPTLSHSKVCNFSFLYVSPFSPPSFRFPLFSTPPPKRRGRKKKENSKKEEGALHYYTRRACNSKVRKTTTSRAPTRERKKRTKKEKRLLFFPFVLSLFWFLPLCARTQKKGPATAQEQEQQEQRENNY